MIKNKVTKPLTLLASALFGLTLAVFVTASGCGRYQGDITPEKLRCEYLENPMGIDIVEPGLSWEVRATDENARGLRQSAYQIQVASSPELLAAGKPDLWDSGEVDSDETVGIVYAGKKLSSRDRCHWRVRVWLAPSGAEGPAPSGVEGSQDGEPSAWSEPAMWTMGLLAASDWQAKWIGDANPPPPDSPPHRGYRSKPDETGKQPKWVAIDLGRETAMDGVRLYGTRVAIPGVGDMPGYLYPLRYRIEVANKPDFSDAKAVVFNDSQDVENPGVQPTTFRFSRTEARFVRIWVSAFRFDEDDKYGFALAELEVLDGERNIALGAKVFAPDGVESDFWAPSKLTDGDIYWHRGGPVTPMTPPVLRKEFSLAKAPKRVTVYSSALGLYEMRINGRRVGNYELAPEWTDYDQIVQYQTYDVTELLKKGSNAVAAQLADGWYAGRIPHAPRGMRGVYGRKPRFLMQLTAEFADGSSETIVTDGSWKSTIEGPLRMADLYDGVTYDARREMPGWDRPGFDDSNWQPVEVDAGVKGELVAQRNEPVRVMHELKPQSVRRLDSGAWLFDLGQNMAGRVRLRVRGKEGSGVWVRHAEMLAPDGGLYVANLRGAYQIDLYTLKGDPNGEVFEPRFTQHGFRYVEVSGLEEEPSVDDLTGLAFHSASEQIGRFESSSQLVNKIWEIILWSQRSNYMGIITDCPQRDERFGWTGSLQPFTHTACFNMDVSALFLKVCRDFRLAQLEDGNFANFAPNPHRQKLSNNPAWSDAGISVPWTGYVHFANRKLLEENYTAGCRMIDSVWERNPELISTEGRKRPWSEDIIHGNYIDLEGYPKEGASISQELFSTAYFAQSTETLAKMARALGRTDDEKKYAELAASIKRAFQERFVSGDGVVQGETQGGYALSLHHGLLPAAQRQAAVANMVEAIRGYDDRLSTGNITTHRMMLELSRGGRNDLAYQLFESRRCPSWGFMVENGATTIWERFDAWVPGRELLPKDRPPYFPKKGVTLLMPLTPGFQAHTMNSFNHQEFGSVGEWMYRVILGIEPDESQPGYKHFFIRPQPGGSLTYARGSLHSVRGLIAVDWHRTESALTLKLTVPPNTTATVTLPAESLDGVTETGVPLAEAEGVSLLDRAARTLRLQSGQYEFVMPTEGTP